MRSRSAADSAAGEPSGRTIRSVCSTLVVTAPVPVSITLWPATKPSASTAIGALTTCMMSPALSSRVYRT